MGNYMVSCILLVAFNTGISKADFKTKSFKLSFTFLSVQTKGTGWDDDSAGKQRHMQAMQGVQDC